MNGTLSIHPKVLGATSGGTLSILVVLVLALFHVTLPDVAVAGITTTLAFAGGWLAPILNAERDRIVHHAERPEQTPFVAIPSGAEPTTPADRARDTLKPKPRARKPKQ